MDGKISSDGGYAGDGGWVDAGWCWRWAWRWCWRWGWRWGWRWDTAHSASGSITGLALRINGTGTGGTIIIAIARNNTEITAKVTAATSETDTAPEVACGSGSANSLDPLDQDGCQKQNRTGDKVGGKSHALDCLEDSK